MYCKWWHLYVIFFYFCLCRGQKKICLVFCILHLFVGMWKRIISHPNVWLASICLALTNSIFSFSFETWLVVEHDKVWERIHSELLHYTHIGGVWKETLQIWTSGYFLRILPFCLRFSPFFFLSFSIYVKMNFI